MRKAEIKYFLYLIYDSEQLLIRLKEKRDIIRMSSMSMGRDTQAISYPLRHQKEKPVKICSNQLPFLSS